MTQRTHEPSFLEGLAVGELTGRLQHEAPDQVKQWVPLGSLKEARGALRKHHYSLVGVTAHPSDPDQVLLVADKLAPGTDPNLLQILARDERFFDGWEVGCLVGLLRYGRPERLEQWVQIRNLDEIQAALDEHHYGITSMRIHPEDKRWTLVIAQPTQTD